MPKLLPEHWRETFCTLIAEGYTLADASKAVQVAPGTVRRYMHSDPEFRALYLEARETVRDTLRNEIWKLRLDEDRHTSRWAYDHLIRWNLPEAKESQRIELTGEAGGPVVVAHERRLTLADVLARAEELGLASDRGLGGGARRELPASPDLLAEPSEGQ